MQLRHFVILAMVGMLAWCAAPAAAVLDMPLGELGAGPAVVVPWGSEPARGYLDVGVKLLPIEPPETLAPPRSVDDIDRFLLDLGQYALGASRVDILFGGISADDVDFGASLPVYANGTQWQLRLGGAYVKGVGPSGLLTMDYRPEPSISALTGKPMAPDSQLGFGLGPSAVMVVYSKRLE